MQSNFDSQVSAINTLSYLTLPLALRPVRWISEWVSSFLTAFQHIIGYLARHFLFTSSHTFAVASIV